MANSQAVSSQGVSNQEMVMSSQGVSSQAVSSQEMVISSQGVANSQGVGNQVVVSNQESSKSSLSSISIEKSWRLPKMRLRKRLWS